LCVMSLMAQSGHSIVSHLMSLSGVKRTCLFALQMSAFDPYRRFATRLRCSAADAERGYPGTNPGITCADWLASQIAIGSWHGRNHHNFNEHPRSPKVGREASPRGRVCRIDPLVPNRIVIFEQTHVSNPDLGA